MEEHGIVSIRIGQASSEEHWRNAVRLDYTEDGDFVGSLFSKHFNIEHIDPDFQEAAYDRRGRRNVRLLLRGISYDEVVLKHLKELALSNTEEANCFVALFNVRYSGGVWEWQTPDALSLWYVGAVRYVEGQMLES